MPKEVASRVAHKTFVQMERLFPSEDASIKDEVARITFEGLMAIGVGAIRGVASGISEEMFEQSKQKMEAALRDQPLTQGIYRRMQRTLIGSVTNQVRVQFLPEEAMGDIKLLGMYADFSRLERRGIDTVLDIRVEDLAFEYRRGTNPEFSFTPEVVVYVFRVRDNTVLHASYLDYRGSRHHFKGWAADDAKAFRVELDLAAETLVQSILEEYFGVPATAPRPVPLAE